MAGGGGGGYFRRPNVFFGQTCFHWLPIMSTLIELWCELDRLKYRTAQLIWLQFGQGLDLSDRHGASEVAIHPDTYII